MTLRENLLSGSREPKKGDSNGLNLLLGAFEGIKEKLTIVLVLRFPDFSKVFEVTCDSSGVGICDMLSQESHTITFFSEKWKRLSNIMITTIESFMPNQSLRYWHCYFLPKSSFYT